MGVFNLLKKINNLFTQEEKERYLKNEQDFDAEQPKELLEEALKSEIFTNKDEVIKVTKPMNFSDSKYIAEVILSGRVVILILDELEENVAQRILDFIMGVCYSQNIAIECFEERKWLINPAHKLHQRALYEDNTYEPEDELDSNVG